MRSTGQFMISREGMAQLQLNNQSFSSRCFVFGAAGVQQGDGGGLECGEGP